MEALKTIARSYAGIGNNDSCIAYALQALKAGNLFQFKADQYALYDELASAYAGKQDYKNAFDAFAASKRIQDSLNKIEVERKMQKLESDYIVAQNERQILSLEKDKKQQQLFIITLIAAIVVGALTGLLIYRNIKTRKRPSRLHRPRKKRSRSSRKSSNCWLPIDFKRPGS